MSRILPILRPLARRFPPLNFWVAQFYDAERSKPPALSPVAVPFDIPQVVKAEVTKNLHMKYRYEWPFGWLLALCGSKRN